MWNDVEYELPDDNQRVQILLGRSVVVDVIYVDGVGYLGEDRLYTTSEVTKWRPKIKMYPKPARGIKDE